MGVIYDIKRYFDAMQKLKELIIPEWELSKNLETITVSRFSFCLKIEFGANYLDLN